MRKLTGNLWKVLKPSGDERLRQLIGTRSGIWFLDRSNPPFYRWFRGGALNTCYNAVDRHVERGRAEQDAIIYDSPVTNSIQKFTFGEVQNRVAKMAGMMVDLGVKKGDTVLIYMPMIPEAVMSMLACARSAPCIQLFSVALLLESWRLESMTPSRTSYCQRLAVLRSNG